MSSNPSSPVAYIPAYILVFILDWIVLSASALQEEQAKHCNNIIVFNSVH